MEGGWQGKPYWCKGGGWLIVDISYTTLHKRTGEAGWLATPSSTPLGSAPHVFFFSKHPSNVILPVRIDENLTMALSLLRDHWYRYNSCEKWVFPFFIPSPHQWGWKIIQTGTSVKLPHSWWTILHMWRSHYYCWCCKIATQFYLQGSSNCHNKLYNEP